MTTTVVRERPIIFSGPMVRAILEGRKTQTRRVVKPLKMNSDYGTPRWDGAWIDGPPNCQYLHVPFVNDAYPDNRTVQRHYCQHDPGDRLWVRETWGVCDVDGGGDAYAIAYKAGGSGDDVVWKDCRYSDCGKYGTYYTDFRWKPSIHMPRWACRLLLEVVSVRVERVQEISGADVLAEGVDNGGSNPAQGKRWENMQRMAFEELWDSLNAKRGFSWASNPWVWVIEFKRISDPDQNNHPAKG